MLLSLFSAFLLSPSPPPKDFGFARISGVDLMTVGRGGNCPQLPPPLRGGANARYAQFLQ